ncbi:MAG: 6,7-dimethyl-8-ribityllumazine synthase [Verrucomicrobiota bacterium]
MSQLSPKPLVVDGSAFSFGIVAARYNEVYVNGLLEDVLAGLRAAGAAEDSIVIERVPGSNELPVAAKWMVETGKFDAIIALGTVIKGGTQHDKMVADGSNYGLHRLALDSGVCVVNGVIAGNDEAQVEERCTGDMRKGPSFAQCALEMADMRRAYAGGQA